MLLKYRYKNWYTAIYYQFKSKLTINLVYLVKYLVTFYQDLVTILCYFSLNQLLYYKWMKLYHFLLCYYYIFRPGRSIKYNINLTFITYATTLHLTINLLDEKKTTIHLLAFRNVASKYLMTYHPQNISLYLSVRKQKIPRHLTMISLDMIMLACNQ